MGLFLRFYIADWRLLVTRRLESPRFCWIIWLRLVIDCEYRERSS